LWKTSDDDKKILKAAKEKRYIMFRRAKNNEKVILIRNCGSQKTMGWQGLPWSSF